MRVGASLDAVALADARVEKRGERVLPEFFLRIARSHHLPPGMIADGARNATRIILAPRPGAKTAGRAACSVPRSRVLPVAVSAPPGIAAQPSGNETEPERTTYSSHDAFPHLRACPGSARTHRPRRRRLRQRRGLLTSPRSKALPAVKQTTERPPRGSPPHLVCCSSQSRPSCKQIVRLATAGERTQALTRSPGRLRTPGVRRAS